MNTHLLPSHRQRSHQARDETAGCKGLHPFLHASSIHPPTYPSPFLFSVLHSHRQAFSGARTAGPGVQGPGLRALGAGRQFLTAETVGRRGRRGREAERSRAPPPSQHLRTPGPTWQSPPPSPVARTGRASRSRARSWSESPGAKRSEGGSGGARAVRALCPRGGDEAGRALTPPHPAAGKKAPRAATFRRRYVAGGGGWGEAAPRSPATRSSGLTLPLARLPRAARARLPFAASVRAKQASWACLFSPLCLVTSWGFRS